MAPTSLPTNPIPAAADFIPLSDPEPLPIDPPLLTVEPDIFGSSDLDLPIALRKGKRYFTMDPISNFISCDRLTLLSYQFAMSIS